MTIHTSRPTYMRADYLKKIVDTSNADHRASSRVTNATREGFGPVTREATTAGQLSV